MGSGKKLAALGALLALTAGGFYFHWANENHNPQLLGFYLTPGLGYFQFGHNAQGEPTLDASSWSDCQYHIERRNGRYRLYTMMDGRLWDESYLVPSQKVLGDWDEMRKDPRSVQGAERYLLAMRSYLHPVQDARVRQYIDGIAALRRAERERQSPPRFNEPEKPSPAAPPLQPLVGLAAAMAADHSNDPYFGLLQMDVLIAAHDHKGLAAALAQWKSRLSEPSPLRVAYRKAEWTLQAWRLSDAGQNAWDFFSRVLGRDVNLADRLKQYPDVLRYDAYIQPMTLIDSFPNFLESQTSVKVFTVEASFLLLQGRKEEALRLLAAGYHHGQLMTQGNTLITRLVGIAVRAYAARGLALDALDGCETPAELQRLWEQLEWLNQREAKPLPPRELFWLEPGPASVPESQWGDNVFFMPNLLEATTRWRVTDARFQLVRMAAAARYRLLTSGALPRGTEDFAPLLPGGPPADAFTSATLKCVNRPEGLTCYSVGPDRADDQGTIEYDPTNGTTSRGDLTLTVPYQRKYPFPAGGVRAANRAEVLAQFPAGLPPDPFADTRGKPLGISDTSPIFIYSYGPDTDEHVLRNPDLRPDVAYDPTNGTTSRGDLFIDLPTALGSRPGNYP